MCIFYYTNMYVDGLVQILNISQFRPQCDPNPRFCLLFFDTHTARFPDTDTHTVSVPLSFASLLPEGTYLSLPPRLYLIIIHLGGRISTVWDIRPATQSHQATSSGPPTLPLISHCAPI